MRYRKRREQFSGSEPTLATFTSRFIALMIDLGIIMLIFYLIFIILKWSGVKIEHISLANFNHIEITAPDFPEKEFFVIKVLIFVIPTIYFTLFTFFTNGQTIGKRILGLRVIPVYHEKIGIWRCFERSLGYLVSTLLFGLGFLQALWHPNRMTLHDRIAETIVIRTLKRKSRSLQRI